MAQSERVASTKRRFRFALLLAGLLCVSPGHVLAEDDLSRDEARKRLDETEQELKSSRVKAEGLTKDLVALAEERARLNSELIEAGKRVQASEAKLSETEGKLAELTEHRAKGSHRQDAQRDATDRPYAASGHSHAARRRAGRCAWRYVAG